MFKVGDMVKKVTNTSLDKGIGIVVMVREYVGRQEHETRNLYFVSWLENNEQYLYEEKELTVISRI